MKTLSITIITTVLLLGMCSCVFAANPYVTATYEPVTQGYLLKFTVHNTLPDNIDMFYITTYDAASPTSPDGWRVYQNYREVSWTALTVEDNIQPWQSKGGFSYIATSQPTTLGCWIGSRDGYNGSVTPTAAPVPEPSSILALFGALASIGGFALKRKK